MAQSTSLRRLTIASVAGFCGVFAAAGSAVAVTYDEPNDLYTLTVGDLVLSPVGTSINTTPVPSTETGDLSGTAAGTRDLNGGGTASETALVSAGLSGQQSLYNSQNEFAKVNPGGPFPASASTTDTVSLGLIPVVTRPVIYDENGVEDPNVMEDPLGYFEFALDFNETNNETGTAVINGLVADLRIDVLTQTNQTINVFQITDDILVVNDNSGGQNSLLGTATDIAVYVPVGAFVRAAQDQNANNTGIFTGNDTLQFTWTDSLESGGPDQWLRRSCVSEGGSAFCFGGDDVMELPVPGALPLLLTALGGLGGLAAMRRRKAAA
ncbi:hypothetical protein LNKW23_05550 [Paralimibaculum aggregatum]|uniref:VPLPA-CTERM sorting domain-containing protein n=1 Tax=Paralimibaculum aggregatum TaxID=3036245 RepID=A0ABQ6LED5_9RHOB|nr:hypothetical protein [Limibaculum sp. NKW23]GMG81342.1 hypothetical protein LNKW23_05550 [Limibaculum sp. NKW23]